MKTMKLWRIAFMMLAAFSLASCSSDDDNEDKVEQQKLELIRMFLTTIMLKVC